MARHGLACHDLFIAPAFRWPLRSQRRELNAWIRTARGHELKLQALLLPH